MFALSIFLEGEEMMAVLMGSQIPREPGASSASRVSLSKRVRFLRPIHTSLTGLMGQQTRRSRRISSRIASRRKGHIGSWTWTSRFSKRARQGL